jgi:hypothetical protein
MHGQQKKKTNKNNKNTHTHTHTRFMYDNLGSLVSAGKFILQANIQFFFEVGERGSWFCIPYSRIL